MSFTENEKQLIDLFRQRGITHVPQKYKYIRACRKFNCVTCDIGFKSTGTNSKYCSVDCNPHKNPWKPKRVKCGTCNIKFTQSSAIHKYCSKACAMCQTQKTGYLFISKIGFCNCCGKPFKRRYESRNYCSDRCKYQLNRPEPKPKVTLYRFPKIKLCGCGIEINLKAKKCIKCSSYKKIKLEPRNCITCGVRFQPKQSNSTACKRNHIPKTPRTRANRKYRKSIKQYKQPISKKYKSEIIEMYENRPEGCHVDHIVPINHPLVCGLHVPWNMQYMEALENLKKGNKIELG